MNDSVDAMAIAAVILLALQRATSSVDEQAQASARAALANLADMPLDQQLQAIERAISILGDYPSASEALLSSLLSMTGDLRSSQSAFIRSLVLPLCTRKLHGVVYVCPIDPAHYRRRSAGSVNYLRCPLHDVQLQPEEAGR